jgi:DNA-directed RNA polymerase III subunit RPC2
MKGLVKQHIDSFDYFIQHGLDQIIKANKTITSDIDPNFFLEFIGIKVGSPIIEEQLISHPITPHECRLRDLTYAAPITVDIRYTRNKQLVTRTDVPIGRMPIMLKSCKCLLRGKNEKEMAEMLECPLDPGGYFITRGTEKVILIQEQLSKNRIIVDIDKKENIEATVTSSTAETKSITKVFHKNGKLYLKHNCLPDDVPIVIAMRALGINSDREIAELVCGNDPDLLNSFSPSLEESSKLKLYSQNQCLEFIGSRVRLPRNSNGTKYVRKAPIDEALDALADLIVAHVPVKNLNFRPKCIYLALMTRRVLAAIGNPSFIDDRDYVGNKRFELAGSLVALLFEDLFKTFQNQVKSLIDKTLQKPNRVGEFDAARFLPLAQNTITEGLNRSISTGNWSLKRFKMERAGVTQVLTRLSYVSALGMMTRISSQFEKTRKVSGPRSLQPSQWGM